MRGCGRGCRSSSATRASLVFRSAGADNEEMLDELDELEEGLGWRSVVVLSLGLIPGLVVIAVFADGIANPGESHSRALIWTLFAIPPVAALVLGFFNGYRPLRVVVLAVGALVMIGVWYAVLLLPAAAVCSAIKGGSCM